MTGTVALDVPRLEKPRIRGGARIALRQLEVIAFPSTRASLLLVGLAEGLEEPAGGVPAGSVEELGSLMVAHLVERPGLVAGTQVDVFQPQLLRPGDGARHQVLAERPLRGRGGVVEGVPVVQ